MPRWLLAWTLMVPLACNPKNPSGFAHGDYDDTGADDTDTGPIGDCPPTLGSVTAVEDDYPTIGWVAEIHVPFTEGSCAIDDGLLYLEWGDGSGSTQTEGPWTVGFQDEQILVETYDGETHEGSLLVVVQLPERGYHLEFETWLEFGDGSTSNHAIGMVN
ncbi:MAG: hypothetical protein ABIO70_36260 [Pseudomonadota bacterium]